MISYEPPDDLTYEDDPRPPRRFRGIIITGVLALAAAAAIVAFLVREQGQGSDTPSGPALLSDTQLRAAPRIDAEIVASLPAETAVDLHGRSEDGAWLVIAEQAKPDPRGWVPLLAVRNAGDLEALPLVAAPPVATSSRSPSPVSTNAAVSSTPSATASSTPTPTATVPPGTADVRVQEVTSRGNRLALIVANVGTANAPPEIDIALDGGAPRRVTLDAVLAPEQSTEVILDDIFVQRRASVTVTVTPVGAGGRPSSATAVVDPDEPNDLEVLAPTADPDDGHLIVTLRNNSPIPLVGVATMSVRQLPTNELLARYDAPFNLAPGATTAIDFADVTALDLASLHVNVETDAVTDAEIDNNSYPR